MKEDLFSYLNEEEKQLFINYFPQISYSKDQLIFKEGDPANFAIVILRGEVILKKKTEFEEKSFILSILRDGSFIGENFFLNDIKKRNVTSIAKTDTTVLFITKDKWSDFSNKYTSLTQKVLLSIINSLSSRLSSMNKRLGAMF